jgi:hypothetical protein
MWRTFFFVLLWMGAGLALTELTAYGLHAWHPGPGTAAARPNHPQTASGTR